MTSPAGQQGTGILRCLKMAMEPPHPFACVQLTADDIEETARVYTDVFLKDEPTSHRHVPDPLRFFPYVRFYVDFCERKKLSFVARDTESLNVIGFILCSDLTTDWDAEGKKMTEFLSHFHETLVAIDELEGRCFDRTRIPPKTILHVFQLGVIREFRSRSVSTALIRRVLRHARDQDFLKVVADCTSLASCHAFERCGFYEAGSISYDAISINGVRFFNGLDGGISLMIQDL